MRITLRGALAPLLLLGAVLMPTAAAPPGETLGRTRTSVERLAPERLEAAHADAARHQAARRELPPLPGLTDYRASMHIHVEDSDHTGGTFAQAIEGARRSGTQILMLSDHYRPPRDFVESRRGIEEGVLFIPGCEWRGFLLYPDRSIMETMDAPVEELIAATTAGTGLIFLSHVEERVDHPMDGLTGMEIYNRHYDAMDDMDLFYALAFMMIDPAQLETLKTSLEKYHAELLATQLDYPHTYIDKWDRESRERRVVGIAAIDCHYNQTLIVKMLDETTVGVGTIFDKDDRLHRLRATDFPSLKPMIEGRNPGDELVRIELDPYDVSFRTVSTHIFAPELSEPAVRAALAAGHAYVSHDWMCDPTGFRFVAFRSAELLADEAAYALMGDETAFADDLHLAATFPVECGIRLLKDGAVAVEAEGRQLVHRPDGPGVYRIEGWLPVDGENRVWIYSNPIYVRP